MGGPGHPLYAVSYFRVMTVECSKIVAHPPVRANARVLVRSQVIHLEYDSNAHTLVWSEKLRGIGDCDLKRFTSLDWAALKTIGSPDGV